MGGGDNFVCVCVWKEDFYLILYFVLVVYLRRRLASPPRRSNSSNSASERKLLLMAGRLAAKEPAATWRLIPETIGIKVRYIRNWKIKKNLNNKKVNLKIKIYFRCVLFRRYIDNANKV